MSSDCAGTLSIPFTENQRNTNKDSAILASPHTPWNFCPNTGAAYAFVIFFALTTIAHITQGILYKKLYCSVIVISGLMQTFTYIFRVVSIKNPEENGPYTAWFVLILVSSLSPFVLLCYRRPNIFEEDRTIVYKCVRVYGYGSSDMEFRRRCENLPCACLEVQFCVCLFRYYVCVYTLLSSSLRY